MKTHLYASAIGLVAMLAGAAVNAQAQDNPPATGLVSLTFQPLPLGAVKPEGWLKQQLRIQADGLSGHLDQFWPDIKDSGWIGGKAEGWERMPYWLDGVVPLAYQLEDEALKKRVEGYIDYILEHQQEDGWLGPQQSVTEKRSYKPRDPWPVFVTLKVLTQYQEATGDVRVIPAMQKYMHCLDKQLDERPLFDWNKSRWQDLVVSIEWLYDRTEEPWLIDFAKQVREQGYDWLAHFNDLPYKKKAEKWEQESHVVNQAMAVKAAGVWYRVSGNGGDLQIGRKSLEELDKYHGQCTGLFTGDECLAGKMPSQGTELCAVTEFMFSLETLMTTTGDTAFADRLESVAFNALPAPFSPDMWAHQYDQQANQVICKVSKDRVYTTNGPDANLYGLEPNYGCCTANMHQGWPKFASHLWMGTRDGGLAAIAYAPSVVSTNIGGVEVTVALDTEYPFREDLHFTVTTAKPVSFPLLLRLPAWAEGATVGMNGDKTSPTTRGFHRMERTWEGTTKFTLHLPMEVRIERRYNNAAVIHRGPLVYSLKVGEYWKYLRGDKPHADYEVYPTTQWNYALALNASKPEESVTFETKPVGECPFSPDGAPVVAKVKGRLLPEWTLDRNAAAAPPKSPVKSDQPLEELTLVPYGCAKLRVTEFPVLQAK